MVVGGGQRKWWKLYLFFFFFLPRPEGQLTGGGIKREIKSGWGGGAWLMDDQMFKWIHRFFFSPRVFFFFKHLWMHSAEAPQVPSKRPSISVGVNWAARAKGRCDNVPLSPTLRSTFCQSVPFFWRASSFWPFGFITAAQIPAFWVYAAGKETNQRPNGKQKK